jgi:hypothetical protein
MNPEVEKARLAAKSMPECHVVEMWSGRLSGKGQFLGYKQCSCVSHGNRISIGNRNANAFGFIRAGYAYCT